MPCFVLLLDITLRLFSSRGEDASKPLPARIHGNQRTSESEAVPKASEGRPDERSLSAQSRTGLGRTLLVVSAP